MRIAFLVLSVFGLALILAACSNEESPTGSVVTLEAAATVEPDPTISSVMEGIEVVKSAPPTAEGVTIVEPLNPTGPTRGGVLAVPMINCPPPDPAIDTASVSVRFQFTIVGDGDSRRIDTDRGRFDVALCVGIGGLLQHERGRSGV